MARLRDYGELSDFIASSHFSDQLRDSSHLPPDLTRFFAGCTALGIEPLEALATFRSNRYFIDAIGLDLLPTTEDVLKWEDSYRVNLLSSVEGHVDAFRGVANCLSVDFQELDDAGFIVIPNAIDESLCDEIQNLVYFFLKRSGSYSYGSGRMTRIYHLIARHPLFLTLLGTPLLNDVMHHFFARPTYHHTYNLASFHANVLHPEAEAQIWHVDANVPDPLPSWTLRANCNFVVHDYVQGCGATEVIPGSHRWLRKPYKEEQDQPLEALGKRSIVAEKGSMVFWHGNLWHRSGENTSPSDRVAVLAAYSSSVLRETSMEENPLLSLSSNQLSALSPFQRRVLGVDHGAKNF